MGPSPCGVASSRASTELRGLSIIINTDYRKITKLKVTFDNDDNRSETIHLEAGARTETAV